MPEREYTSTMKTLPYPAPDFNLSDTSGNNHQLADYKGKWLVLYFYPKDDTPGCTVEACSFRDAYADLLAHKAEVIGISKDDAMSHDKFTKKYDLPFTLLSDPDGAVIETYGAWGKKMFGREGILRKTFVIDPDGAIVKVYGRVTPVGHAQAIVQLLKELQTNN